MGSTTGPIVFKTMPFQTAPSLSACDPQLAQTPHPAGMPVALADGSVRLLTSSITQWTFWAACTPSGREVLGSDW